MTEAWKCRQCERLHIVIGGRRGNEGYDGRCVGCSVETAEAMLPERREAAWDTGLVVWYIEHLKRQVKARDAEIREEARYSAGMANDLEWERRRG